MTVTVTATAWATSYGVIVLDGSIKVTLGQEALAQQRADEVDQASGEAGMRRRLVFARARRKDAMKEIDVYVVSR